MTEHISDPISDLFSLCLLDILEQFEDLTLLQSAGCPVDPRRQ